MQKTDRIRPARRTSRANASSLDAEGASSTQRSGLYVPLGWDDLKSGKHHGRGFAMVGGTTRQPLEPAQLCSRILTRRRVALGRYRQPMICRPRFDVAALASHHRGHAADLTGLTATGSIANPVPASGRARSPYPPLGWPAWNPPAVLSSWRQRDIGGSFIEPAQEVRQPCADAVDVIGDDPHRPHRVTKRPRAQRLPDPRITSPMPDRRTPSMQSPSLSGRLSSSRQESRTFPAAQPPRRLRSFRC